jgi:LacI family transcriptional regulator
MAKVSTVNVREIAKAAGVSHITVSRALRGGQNVAEKTRLKVEKTARELGYRPNPLIQAYTTQIRRSRGIAPSCNLAWLPSEPKPGNDLKPWIVPFLRGAEQRADELGFFLDATLNAHQLSDESLQRLLDSRGIRGLIIPQAAYHYRQPFLGRGIAAVWIGESPDPCPAHSVSQDYFKNLTTAVDALLACGYERIAFCEHDHATVMSQGATWGAFLFNQQRLKTKIPMLGHLNLTRQREETSRKRFLKWIKEHQPDVIMTTFFHARDWLEQEGITVPGDVGLAHLSLAPDVAGWSGIDAGPEAIGSAAVDMLVAHILRNEFKSPLVPKLMRLPGRWLSGDTTRRGPPDSDATLPLSHTHPHDWFERWFWSVPR